MEYYSKAPFQLSILVTLNHRLGTMHAKLKVSFPLFPNFLNDVGEQKSQRPSSSVSPGQDQQHLKQHSNPIAASSTRRRRSTLWQLNSAPIKLNIAFIKWNLLPELQRGTRYCCCWCCRLPPYDHKSFINPILQLCRTKQKIWVVFSSLLYCLILRQRWEVFSEEEKFSWDKRKKQDGRRFHHFHSWQKLGTIAQNFLFSLKLLILVSIKLIYFKSYLSCYFLVKFWPKTAPTVLDASALTTLANSRVFKK